MDKLSYDQLGKMLEEARENVPIKTRWRHYKGGEYLVYTLVIREAEQDVAVEYASVEHEDIPMTRPLAEWNESVETENGSAPRFTQIPR